MTPIDEASFDSLINDSDALLICRRIVRKTKGQTPIARIVSVLSAFKAREPQVTIAAAAKVIAALDTIESSQFAEKFDE